MFPKTIMQFCRDHGITQISFSIDELEGANKLSGFAGRDFKPAIAAFLVAILERAYGDNFPLHIREVERIAQKLAGVELSENEQIEPWAAIVVAADGRVSMFSPEFDGPWMRPLTTISYSALFGKRLRRLRRSPAFQRANSCGRARHRVREGILRISPSAAASSPVDKFSEKGDMAVTETDFCRSGKSTSADALMEFLSSRARGNMRDQ